MRDFYDRRFINISKRLLKETSDSMEIAMKIQKNISKENLEIHADVNEDIQHNSSRYKNLIPGYISGFGFDVKIKPYSFVTSSIDDSHTRKF